MMPYGPLILVNSDLSNDLLSAKFQYISWTNANCQLDQ